MKKHFLKLFLCGFAIATLSAGVFAKDYIETVSLSNSGSKTNSVSNNNEETVSAQFDFFFSDNTMDKNSFGKQRNPEELPYGSNTGKNETSAKHLLCYAIMYREAIKKYKEQHPEEISPQELKNLYFYIG